MGKLLDEYLQHGPGWYQRPNGELAFVTAVQSHPWGWGKRSDGGIHWRVADDTYDDWELVRRVIHAAGMTG
jgi:hypothetical protein